MRNHACLPLLMLAVCLGLVAVPADAQDVAIASVNGRTITEADLKLAEAEIGGDLGNLPQATRRRVLLEYVIENQLFADAAEGDKLSSGSAFDNRMQYWRRRALRDTYFDRSVKSAISEDEIRKFYETQMSGMKPEEELRARHILVESEDKAKEIFEKIGHGAEFAQMAREHSKDPGSKDDGGDLGYFSRGQMVPQFEDAAFKLKKGDVSLPVQSQFGWHLIKLEDRRERPAPSFDSVRERISAALVHRKAQEIAGTLRTKAKIEVLDADLKRQMDEAEKAVLPKR